MKLNYIFRIKLNMMKRITLEKSINSQFQLAYLERHAIFYI